jgi:hypothetical protein
MLAITVHLMVRDELRHDVAGFPRTVPAGGGQVRIAVI